ncbi:hypothetical protein [Macrococcus capreoli]|uniref:hypothetical protein n=1 Tax=Macrococcus capreoli TaxID=2982690 RepID=UPI0021D5704F|nr:hypothetical protein [Macrococcus sp. TMW 2.2395]MCU7556601.1 hypothetical protein [Macrococcus sp. TMW 2.2395]
MAIHYSDKPVEKWNVRNLTDYLCDEHRNRFGIDYAPFGSWQAERGTIGRVFGTARKEGTHNKRLIKEWIDYVFETYKPSQQYPGISFGFAWKYRQSDLQVVQKRLLDEDKAAEIEAQPLDDVAEWFKA